MLEFWLSFIYPAFPLPLYPPSSLDFVLFCRTYLIYTPSYPNGKLPVILIHYFSVPFCLAAYFLINSRQMPSSRLLSGATNSNLHRTRVRPPSVASSIVTVRCCPQYFSQLRPHCHSSKAVVVVGRVHRQSLTPTTVVVARHSTGKGKGRAHPRSSTVKSPVARSSAVRPSAVRPSQVRSSTVRSPRATRSAAVHSPTAPLSSSSAVWGTRAEETESCPPTAQNRHPRQSPQKSSCHRSQSFHFSFL